MDFVWYFPDVVLSASFAKGPNVANQAGEERLATSCLPQNPGRSIRHLTSAAIGWVIRRPLVDDAFGALLSAASEGEQAATPPTATSAPSLGGWFQPSASANAWRCAQCGCPTAHRREPGRSTFCFARGPYQLTSSSSL
jgi:hypothetical protein